jgi:hypothetical protein
MLVVSLSISNSWIRTTLTIATMYHHHRGAATLRSLCHFFTSVTVGVYTISYSPPHSGLQRDFLNNPELDNP